MKNIVVIAPHPDDETLGCGGALLKHVDAGHFVHWVIVTTMNTEDGFSCDRMNSRKLEISKVASLYNFSKVHSLGYPSMRLDEVPKRDLVNSIGKIVRTTKPEVIYLPYRNDAHSDHAAVFDTAVACTKIFRYPNIKSIRVYETLSETEFGLRSDDPGFKPNLFIEISPFLEKKIEIMKVYKSEIGEFPFPRSEVTLRAQANLRGSQAGVMAAEAFMLLKEIQ